MNLRWHGSPERLQSADEVALAWKYVDKIMLILNLIAFTACLEPRACPMGVSVVVDACSILHAGLLTWQRKQRRGQVSSIAQGGHSLPRPVSRL